MSGASTWLAAAAVGLAPVPADPPADPTGWGFMGVQMSQADGRVRLTKIEPGLPADRAGLRVGDELVRVGNLTPQSVQDIIQYVIVCRPGTRLRVEAVRDGGPIVARVRLVARPDYLPPPQPQAD